MRPSIYGQSVFTQPLHRKQDVTQGQFFLVRLNKFEFKIFLLLDRLPYNVKECSLSLWRKSILIQEYEGNVKMKTAKPRIWTRVAYNHNHYTTSASIYRKSKKFETTGCLCNGKKSCEIKKQMECVRAWYQRS